MINRRGFFGTLAALIMVRRMPRPIDIGAWHEVPFSFSREISTIDPAVTAAFARKIADDIDARILYELTHGLPQRK